MPGLDHCGRCGASLHLKTTVIDVRPPRRSERSLRLSTANRLAGLRRDWREFYERWLSRPFGSDGPELRGTPGDVLKRMFVPGWPQMFLGQAIRGRALFGTWIGLAVLSLLLWGTFIGSMFLGLTFAVHLASIIDLVFSGTSDPVNRIFRSVLYGAVVIGVVYVPPMWVLRHVAVAQQLNWETGDWNRGDVILYNVWATPRPGSVVLYDMRTINLTPNARIGGRQMDRILAGPGQIVTVQKGKMMVDGAEPQWKPLVQNVHFDDGRITVPAGYFLVAPTSNPMISTVPAGLWMAHGAGLIPRSAIVGTAYRHPLGSM